MSRRTFEVQFEAFVGREWQWNWAKRVVIVTGGAEAAIHEATKREKKANKDCPVRATEVRCIAEED